jgi:hypothetical protein
LESAVLDDTVSVVTVELTSVLILNPFDDDVLKNSNPVVGEAFDQLLMYSPVPANEPALNFTKVSNDQSPVYIDEEEFDKSIDE